MFNRMIYVADANIFSSPKFTISPNVTFTKGSGKNVTTVRTVSLRRDTRQFLEDQNVVDHYHFKNGDMQFIVFKREPLVATATFSLEKLDSNQKMYVKKIQIGF